MAFCASGLLKLLLRRENEAFRLLQEAYEQQQLALARIDCRTSWVDCGVPAEGLYGWDRQGQSRAAANVLQLDPTGSALGHFRIGQPRTAPQVPEELLEYKYFSYEMEQDQPEPPLDHTEAAESKALTAEIESQFGYLEAALLVRARSRALQPLKLL